jgi:hypothetical protein
LTGAPPAHRSCSPKGPVRCIPFEPAADRPLTLAHNGSDLPYPQLLLGGQQHHLGTCTQPHMMGSPLERCHRIDLLCRQRRHVEWFRGSPFPPHYSISSNLYLIVLSPFPSVSFLRKRFLYVWYRVVPL